jgi:hypothetical protein
MKRQKFKYPGDAALQRLLEKYNCPTPFHVVRMRFLGEIASLDFGASPIKTIESFWDGDLPVFDRKEEGSAFFQAMMSLWNRLARHQDGVLVKLFKLKKLREWDDVAAAFRMRAEEIRDGFLVGYAGSGTDQHLPESLEEALHGLNEIADRFDEAAERVQGPERDEDELSLADFRQVIEVRTKEVETLLTAIMGASKELRKLGILAASEIDEGTSIH